MASVWNLIPMHIDPIFNDAFSKLYGKPAWNVQPGYGSFLTLEFGRPHLEVHEPRERTPSASPLVKRERPRRIVRVRGDWHLWIHCCDWGVLEQKKLQGDCSTKRRIQRAAQFLDGQKLTNVEVVWRGCRTVFEFDLGGRLETKPYSRKDEQWMLFEPSGHVLTLRADKTYKYGHVETLDSKDKWKPIANG